MQGHLFLALLASALTSSAPDDGECAAAIVPDPYPNRDINRVIAGYLGSDTYEVWGISSPELVPLAIEASDSDELLVYCDGGCTRMSITAESDVDWNILPAESDPGRLIDPAAGESLSDQNSTCQLYMPPTDLNEGESRTVFIQAVVHEICDYARDPDTLVLYQADIRRNATFDWDVSVKFVEIETTALSPEACEPKDYSECELVGPVLDPNPLVSGMITEYPSGGMVLGELRPIRTHFYDTDIWWIECGIPIHNPPISKFASTPVCDDMNYAWSVVAGPGSGEFLYADRATLFRATAPGDVTVRVDVTTSDGETAYAFATFTIVPALVNLMEFKNHRTLVSDNYWIPYGSPHWLDQDDDGNADDPPVGSPPVYEQNFPVAYVQSEQVQFSQIIIKAGAPAPKPMPGTALRGTSMTQTTFEGPAIWQAATSEWACLNPLTKGDLPETIKKYDPYTIAWSLDFGGGKVVDINTTKHRIYVTLVVPQDPYGAYESLYDIACGQADGKDNAVAAALDIWDCFKGLDVKRVARSGWNEPIAPATMTYWGGTGQPPFTVHELLRTGNGSCSSWARLLRAVLAIHQVDSWVIALNVTPDPPGADVNLLVQNWAGPGGNGPWPATQVADKGSIPAQGGTPAAHNFKNHAVVLVGNYLVDPSFGKGPYFDFAKMFIDLENDILFGTIPDMAAPQNVFPQDKEAADLVPSIIN